MIKLLYEGIEFNEIEYANNPRLHDYCHGFINKNIKLGFIKKQPCEICNSVININAHHEDYSMPENVRWLCHKHHLIIHSLLRSVLNYKKIQSI